LVDEFDELWNAGDAFQIVEELVLELLRSLIGPNHTFVVELRSEFEDSPLLI
jgi:hypothetical protein